MKIANEGRFRRNRRIIDGYNLSILNGDFNEGIVIMNLVEDVVSLRNVPKEEAVNA
jgi:hypothetical protein